METKILRNERDWAGQLISWIKSAIENKTTIFQDATNDTSVKMTSGQTKFPDILLFIDKVSGLIFNGWELKFPDTKVDDAEMLKNALEKAQKIQSDSFVTWNGAEAIIWKIDTTKYTLDSLEKIKIYPKVPSILSRKDLANPTYYYQHETALHNRAIEILHDLEQLYLSGCIKPALNVTNNFIDAISQAAQIVIPQFKNAIIIKKGQDVFFREEFNRWKIYENVTLRILKSSSRREEFVEEEDVLAKFTFYSLIGKIIFYLTLRENLSGLLDAVSIKGPNNIKKSLQYYFDKAQAIDYQAIFMPYFTDSIDFSDIANQAIYQLIGVLTEFDFKILPVSVIGNILENLVPKEEKQKFGQYFTSETLANLVAFPAVQTNNDFLFDPTSGTGTFLNAFYKILSYHNNTNHSKLLDQIWGNDISHFPAILSVINLYKQDVSQKNNFPRVKRDDFFNLSPGDSVSFPDPIEYSKHINLTIPFFDGIASNFPFIQQEDIPNDKLTLFFRQEFEASQQAFLRDNSFKINERSDYFTYCVYNSIRFLKDNGMLSFITSNAWLGKEYGFQFKKFLLDNFHIKYIVKSNAEHWFTDSQVSTIYVVLQKCHCEEPTKFVSINFKLKDYFSQNDIKIQLHQIEDFYSEIDNCDNPKNPSWSKDLTFDDLYVKNDKSISVCFVKKEMLVESIDAKTNWCEFFISTKLFESFNNLLIKYYPNVIDVCRGERTGWNNMFIIKNKDVASTSIDNKYLVPCVKSSSELETIEFGNDFQYKFFVCKDRFDDLSIGTKNWILQFKNCPNKNGRATIEETCKGHKPFWYSLNLKPANIITSINPYKRLFFTFSTNPFYLDQRLVAISVKKGYDVELMAALLNSAINLLTVEMRGTSRNLGALDLNADYFKEMKSLDPSILTPEQIIKIKQAFEPLKHRKVQEIFDEIKNADRINFDRTVLSCYGINESLLDNIYSYLTSSVNDRVNMQNR